MNNARRSAHRFRRLLLIGALAYALFGFAWITYPLIADFLDLSWDEGAGLWGTPFVPHDVDASTYGFFVALFLAGMLLVQYLYLRPARGWLGRLASDGRPLRSSIVVAGLMGAFLTVGLVSLLFELADAWAPNSDRPLSFWATTWAGIGVLWAAWAWIFFVYWRQGDRYSQLGKMIRALVSASILEAVVAVPVHIWATRQRGCYCARGSYTTLVFAGTVVLWAFGPGIVLLFLRERYRREKLYRPCPSCGYNLTGNTSGVCPECGTDVENLRRAP